MTFDPNTFDNGIDDDIFAKIIACIRISVPYTGMIISTRESQACEEKVLKLGISQISGGSKPVSADTLIRKMNQKKIQLNLIFLTEELRMK